MKKFTFKTTKPTGRYKSFYEPYHEIKLKGDVVENIDSITYKIRLMVMKDGLSIVDDNPNCDWKWITLARNSTSLNDAKEWLNYKFVDITEKYQLKHS